MIKQSVIRTQALNLQQVRLIPYLNICVQFPSSSPSTKQQPLPLTCRSRSKCLHICIFSRNLSHQPFIVNLIAGTTHWLNLWQPRGEGENRRCLHSPCTHNIVKIQVCILGHSYGEKNSVKHWGSRKGSK